MVGVTLGRYRIIEKLGQGGIGIAYLADDTLLERRVVVKVLRDDLLRDEAHRARFLREARLAASLTHPHIAAIYDVGEADGRVFIAMEHVDGESLRTRLAGGRLDVREALDIGIDAAGGLASAHAVNMVHRDVTPANIMLSKRHGAKLIDFGLARLVERDSPDTETHAEITRHGEMVGTAAYASPEQIRGESVDHRSDIFSLGVVLHEMLAGRPLFARSSMADTLSAVLRDEPAPIDDRRPAPGGIDLVLEKMLQKDRARRYQSTADLVLDLCRVRDGAPAVSRRPRRALVVVAAALALAAVGGAAVWLATSRSAPAIGTSGRPAIAVLDFETPGLEPDRAWVTQGLPQMIVTALAETPGLDVIAPPKVDASDSAQTEDRSAASARAQKAGAGAILVGHVFSAGPDMRVEVQVQDLATRRIIAAHSARGSDVFALADELSRQVLNELRVASAAARRVADVSSSSPEAYRLFTEGLVARRNLRIDDARRALERAVAIDPAFASAYAELAILADLARDPASGVRYRRLAYEHLDRLPERQKRRLQVWAARREGDARLAIEIGERLVADFPDDGDGYHMLAHAYEDLEDLPTALDRWQRAITLAPDQSELHNEFGYALLGAGRPEDALAELETYARLAPGEPNAYDSLGEASMVLGQPEKALDHYATALRINPRFESAYNGRAWAFSLMGRYDEALAEAERRLSVLLSEKRVIAEASLTAALIHGRTGRYREAERLLERALADARAVQNPSAEAGIHLVRASMALARNRFGDAVASAEVARSLDSRVSARERGRVLALGDLLGGLAEIGLGRHDAAIARARPLGVSKGAGKILAGWVADVLVAEAALARGDLDAAGEAFRSAGRRPRERFNLSSLIISLAHVVSVADGPARLRLAQGDAAGARALYDQLLTPSATRRFIAPLEPRHVFALAGLLARSGDTAAARAGYERFLALWSRADPDAPELQHARAGLRR